MSLTATNDAVELGVTDDGIGFTASSAGEADSGSAAWTNACGSPSAASEWNRDPGTERKWLVRIANPVAAVPLEAVHST